MAVHDFPAAAEFYSAKLGMVYTEDEALPFWRCFGTRRTTFELFLAHPDRVKVEAWGKGQAFRPVLLVRDLVSTEAWLNQQGISSTRSTSAAVAQIEMTGPEGIRWGLTESADGATDRERPVIGGIELKTNNLEAQTDFYTRILGMQIQHQTNQGTLLNQHNSDTWLYIESGGTSAPSTTEMAPESPAFLHPVWISFETQDARAANFWLQRQGISMLRPLTYHADWKGTDSLLADADNNIVQVVQYGKTDIS